MEDYPKQSDLVVDSLWPYVVSLGRHLLALKLDCRQMYYSSLFLLLKEFSYFLVLQQKIHQYLSQLLVIEESHLAALGF
jgi:hypothetical protein